MVIDVVRRLGRITSGGSTLATGAARNTPCLRGAIGLIGAGWLVLATITADWAVVFPCFMFLVLLNSVRPG